MSVTDELTRVLARKAGVSPSWGDMEGVEHPVSIETLRALLEAIGYPCAQDSDLRNSMAALDAGVFPTSAQAHFVTARVGAPVALPRTAGDGGSFEVEYEDGERRSVRSIEGFKGALTLPAFDRPGYHIVRTPAGEYTVATAPPRCQSFLELNQGRNGWGVAAQVYSLGAGVECGAGDFGGVAQLVRSTARLGADILAISPVHALLGVPERFDSPYSPSSRQFYDPIYADPMLVFPASLVQDAAATAGINLDAPRSDKVDWATARPRKMGLLASLFAMRERWDAQIRTDFDEFQAGASPALHRHAVFDAIRSQMGSIWDWRRWPAGLRSATSEQTRDFAGEHAQDVALQLFLQWVTQRSCAAVQAEALRSGMTVGLIADVATGQDPAGSDAWGRPAELLRGVTLGAPPDLFTTAGQDWQLTTFSPYGLAASGFAPFIELLRGCMRNVGGVRIDHVMGLQRLWLIPEGMGARNGTYVNYPAETLFRLLALESWRHRAVVIGEDLGTLPYHFQDYLLEQGIMGMRLLRIQRRGDAWMSPSEWTPEAAALSATHDIVATGGWWRGVDIQRGGSVFQEPEQRETDRRMLWDAFRDAGVAQGETPRPDCADTVVDAAFDFLAKTPCQAKLVTLEDVLANDIQINVPGTTSEQPNWTIRYEGDVGQMLTQPKVAARLSKLEAPSAASRSHEGR